MPSLKIANCKLETKMVNKQSSVYHVVIILSIQNVFETMKNNNTGIGIALIEQPRSVTPMLYFVLNGNAQISFCSSFIECYR